MFLHFAAVVAVFGGWLKLTIADKWCGGPIKSPDSIALPRSLPPLPRPLVPLAGCWKWKESAWDYLAPLVHTDGINHHTVSAQPSRLQRRASGLRQITGASRHKGTKFFTPFKSFARSMFMRVWHPQSILGIRILYTFCSKFLAHLSENPRQIWSLAFGTSFAH